MKKIVRELRSLPGAMVAILVLLIVTFWVINFLQNHAPAPINNAAGWTLSHATGASYLGSPAAPVVAVGSPYSANANIGPFV
jgi:hypothetical protein